MEGNYMDCLLGSIVAQVLRHRSKELIKLGETFREQHKYKTACGADYVALIKLTLPFIRTLYVIVDALDELDQAPTGASHGGRRGVASESQVKLFTKNLGRLISGSEDKLRMLTTTRPAVVPEDEFVFALPSVQMMEIETSDEDLRTYIRRRIDEAPPRFFNLQNDLRKEIIDTIAGKSQARYVRSKCCLRSYKLTSRRFILGRLHFDALRLSEQGSPGELQIALTQLRPEVDDYYDAAMARVGNVEAVKRLMRWILVLPHTLSEHKFASWESKHPTRRKGPLHIQELRHAIAVSGGLPPDNLVAMERFIPQSIVSLVGSSGGLCVMNENEDTVSYAHPTVQQYLLDRQAVIFPNIEVDRCRACIAYLSLKDFEKGACTTRAEWNSRLEQFPFLEYAARHWCQVRRFSQASEEVNRQVEDQIVRLLSHAGLLANLAQCQAYSNGWMGTDSIHIPRTTALIVAMQFNLLGVMTKLLGGNTDDPRIDVNEQNEVGQTALDLAVTAGLNFATLLLNHHAEVRSEADTSGNRKARNALNIAVAYLRDAVQDRTTDVDGGCTQFEVVRLLLDHDPTLTIDAHERAESSLDLLNQARYMTMMPEVDDDGIQIDEYVVAERFNAMQLDMLQEALNEEQSARPEQQENDQPEQESDVFKFSAHVVR